jgi:hypothetical protein
LIRLHVADAVAGPLQLLELDRLEYAAQRRPREQRRTGVGLELEDGAFGDLGAGLGVVHQLLVRNAAVGGEPVSGVHRDRHALRPLQADAVCYALPALGVSLLVRPRRADQLGDAGNG